MAEPPTMEEINLDKLNPKQKLKVFKSVCKEIKSKDSEIKTQALIKFKHDCRYLTEGGCMMAFIESIGIKKKSLDFSKTALQSLVGFVEAKDCSSGGIIATVAGLRNLLDNYPNDFSVFQSIADALTYKEEVKKPKPKGKMKDVVVEEEVPEADVVISIRRLALRATNAIVSVLLRQVRLGSDNDLAFAFARVPNLAINLFECLAKIFERYHKNPEETVLEELMWVLASIAFVLDQSQDAISNFMSTSGIQYVIVLCKDKCLNIFCVRILEILSKTESSLPGVAETSSLEVLIKSLEICKDEFVKQEAEAQAALDPKAMKAAAANAKKDKGKKDNSKDKEEEQAKTPEQNLIVYNIKSLMVGIIATSASCLSSVAKNLSSSLLDDSIERIVSSISKILTSTIVWGVNHYPDDHVYNIPLGEALDTCCVLLGDISLIGGGKRRAACKQGAVAALLHILRNSVAVVGEPLAAGGAGGAGGAEGATGTSDDDELANHERAQDRKRLRLLNLRRIAERALLALLTEKRDSSAADDQSPSPSPSPSPSSEDIIRKVRWPSCDDYVTDLDLLIQSSEVSLGVLVDIIACGDDVDLSNRGVRVLSALLHSTAVGRISEFISAVNIDRNVITKLSVVAESLFTAVLANLQQRNKLLLAPVVTTDAEQAGDASPAPAPAPVSAPAPAPASATAAAAAAAAVVTEASCLIPGVEVACYLVLVSLEILLQTSFDFVNVFGAKERITMLAKILYEGGLNSNVTNATPELQFAVCDTRRYDWRPDAAHDYGSCYEYAAQLQVLLRPIAMDVLTILAASDRRYRTFEGEIPPIPCQPLPEMRSACREVAMTTCKVCADATCSILMSQASFAWRLDEYVTVGTSLAVPAQTLDRSVINAALGLLASMASAGADGHFGILESIVDASSPGRESRGSATLANIINTFQSIWTGDGEAPSSFLETLNPSGAWTRPSHFTDVFPPSSGISVFSNRLTWPFAAVCASVLGTLANPTATDETVLLAIQAFTALSRVDVLSDFSQPVVTDIFACVFAALGGVVTLVGSVGRFGTLGIDHPKREQSSQFAAYLFARGRCREGFWQRWADDHKEPEKIDPKTGKAQSKPKEVKPPPAKGAKDAKPTTSIVAETKLNLEPAGDHIDPNKGPSTKFWGQLLSVKHNDTHTKTALATPLTTAAQGLLTNLSQLLTLEDINLDERDGEGLTAMMYALLTGDSALLATLLTAGANPNELDSSGNPTIKYASLTIDTSDWQQLKGGVLAFYQSGDGMIRQDPSLLRPIMGYNTLLEQLVAGGVDVRVGDTDGNSPLLNSLGLAVSQLYIGGYRVSISNFSYKNQNICSEAVPVIECLLKAGCSPDFCNKKGMVPLHIAASQGDRAVLEVLFKSGCIPNATDSRGFLPLHYTAAACPPSAPEIIELILEHSKDRPIEAMTFSDDRVGLTPTQKYNLDAERLVRKILGLETKPRAVAKRRRSSADLLGTLARDINVLQLAMCAQAILPKNVSSYLPGGGKDDRMKFALYLMKLAEKMGVDLISNVTSRGLTALHCASLLFEGSTPRTELTPAQKRNKRYKSYESVELNILDLLLTSGRVDPTGSCDVVGGPMLAASGVRLFVEDTRQGLFQYPNNDGSATLHFPETCTSQSVDVDTLKCDPWTPLHAAIATGNVDLVQLLLSQQIPLSQYPYVHYVAQRGLVQEVCDLVVAAATSSPSFNGLLNGLGDPWVNCRPLHLAVQSGNAAAIRSLAKSAKTDLNARDESPSGITAFHQACLSYNTDLIDAFEEGAERLDFLIPNLLTAATVVDDMSRHFAYLQVLARLRKNDVLQHMLSLRAGKDTLLAEIEHENISLAQNLGFFATEDEPKKPTPELDTEDTAVGESAGGEGTAVVQEGVQEGEQIETPEMVTQRLADVLSYSYELRNSNVLLHWILGLVHDAGFAGTDVHVHKCFSLGMVYSEYAQPSIPNQCSTDEN